MSLMEVSPDQVNLSMLRTTAPDRPRLIMLRRLLRNKGALIAAHFLAIFGFVALFAPQLAPHDPVKQNLRTILKPPTTVTGVDRDGNTVAPNYLGTDKIGRDLLSRILYGARVSFLVALISVGASCVVGTALGVIAGYYRGKIDTLIMTIADIQLSFPAILLSIIIVAGLGPGLRNTIIVLAITSWVSYARIIRAETLSLREREFVDAARALGASDFHITFRHVLPQMLPVLLVLTSFEIGRVIVLEATLSFLGLGVQPPTASWGNILADGRELLWTAWWMAFFPGLALTIVSWATSTLGDWLRDATDPRLNR